MKLAFSVMLSLAVAGSAAAPTFAAAAHAKASAHAVKSKVSAAKAHAASMKDLAPADEYFGPLKMSILGINNALVQVKRRQSSGDMSADTEKSMHQVENSIHDWEHKYPRDPWIARALLNVHNTYAIFPDRNAHEHALASASWLTKKYPHTKQAKEVRRLLALAPAAPPVAPAAAPAVVPAAAAAPAVLPAAVAVPAAPAVQNQAATH